MSTTARLALPYIAPQQAQKQVTYNGAMALLDQLVQPAVESRTIATPPGMPIAGASYIAAPSSTGAWAGKDNALVCWRDGGWHFAVPAEGWMAYVLDAAELVVFDGAAWAVHGVSSVNGATGTVLLDAADIDVTPTGGIGATTVQAALAELDAEKLAATALDADGTLAANSDTRIATQKAVKTYADALIAANDAMVFKGVVDCSANPDYPAADRGHTWRVSVAGRIGGASGIVVEAGDMLICLTDATSTGNQASVGGAWSIIQVNLDGAMVSGSYADLVAIEALAGTGLAARIAANSWAQRTLAGTGSEIAVANGDGVAGNPTISLPATLALRGKTVQVDQLAFPAAQSASSDPNTLDDYEEGTWTPTILFGGAATGITYGTQLGRYTKIGRLVTAVCSVVLTSKGSATGTAQVGGLPFVSVNDSILSSAVVGFASNTASVTGAVLAMVQNNSARINLYHSNNGAAAALSNANFTNTTNLLLTASYETS